MNILINYCLVLIVNITIGVYCGNYSSENPSDVWWGPTNLQGVSDQSVRPFKVEFNEEVINDLRQRLRNHRPVTPPLEGVGFDYGFNTDFLEDWVQYWANGYNFKEREAFLNQFPQYKTNIQGLDIHFLWVKPKVHPYIETVPLLFLHGWPGTVRELYEAIPYLTGVDGERNFAVEVIAPNLPGFAFSHGAVRPGLGALEMAVVIKNLMQRLGFHQFYIQGGDWGSRVGSFIATLYPEMVLGFHTNLPLSRSPLSFALWIGGILDPTAVVDRSLVDRLYPMRNILVRLMRETGYMHLQATKPDSLGVAMSDSPAGLLAYLLQLISSGTRQNNPSTYHGGLDEYYSKDGLLDILTIIWTTNSFTTCSRIYAESMNLRAYNSSVETRPTQVPTWTIQAKDEIIYQSPIMLKFKFPNLLHSTILEDGGHFLAFEKPAVFASDVLRAIDVFRKYHEMNKLRRDEF